MVSVLAVSDETVEYLWSSQVRSLGVDVILGAGDLPFAYLEYLSDQLNAPCVFVPGNHDVDLSGYSNKRSGWMRAGMPAQWPGAHRRGQRRRTHRDRRRSADRGPRWFPSGTTPAPISGPSASRVDALARSPGETLGNRDFPAVGGAWMCCSPTAPPVASATPRIGHIEGSNASRLWIHNLDPTVMVHGHIHPHGRTPLDLEVGRTIVLNTVGFTLMEISPGTPPTIVRRRHGS